MIRLGRMSCCWVVLAWGWCGVGLQAQEAPATTPAVLSFDLNFEKLGELRPLKEMVDHSPPMQGPDGEIIRGALQVSGVVGAPAQLTDLFAMQPNDPIPFDFTFRIRFADAEAAQRLLDQTKGEREEVTEFGKTWFKPTGDAGAPANLRIQVVNPTTLEFGTIGYMSQAADKTWSAALRQSWAGMPEHSLRIAADFDAARAFVNEALAMAKEQTPPEARAFLGPIDKISGLQFSVDGGGQQLLSLTITGVDDAGASDIHDGVEALLGLVRMAAGEQVAMMKERTPETARVAEEILSALNSQLAGKTVKLVVPRPMGFEAAIEEALRTARDSNEKLVQMNDVKQVALAIHNFHDAYNQLPAAKQQGLSWRVAVLPYLEQEPQFRKFDLEKPWDDGANRAAAENMPQLFGDSPDGFTGISLVVPARPVQRLADIKDGLSNTIMLVRAPTEIPWSKPQDLTVDQVIALYEKLPADEALIVCMYDGAVRPLRKGIDLATLQNLLEPADGNPIDLDKLD